MSKPAEKQRVTSRAIYLRLEPELVQFLDQEARRLRRSRAFVIGQACRLLQAVRDQWSKEEQVQ